MITQQQQCKVFELTYNETTTVAPGGRRSVCVCVCVRICGALIDVMIGGVGLLYDRTRARRPLPLSLSERDRRSPPPPDDRRDGPIGMYIFCVFCVQCSVCVCMCVAALCIDARVSASQVGTRFQRVAAVAAHQICMPRDAHKRNMYTYTLVHGKRKRKKKGARVAQVKGYAIHIVHITCKPLYIMMV